MSKPTKGLYIDVRPQDQPEGTYPFAKNGIQHDVVGSVFNEPGFRKLSLVVPYILMGIIETDSKAVLFSTDNTNSAIGYFNPITELYEAIIDDNPSHLVNWPSDGSRLEFSMDWYITGQSQRNYKGEMVVAWTDKNKWPKYLNCDNPSISTIDDLRLFPYFKSPVITAVPVVGGRVDAGTYYIAVGYERNDGTSTTYSPLSKFVTIPPLNGVQGLTDKAIEITITGADTSFDSMRIAIISKIQGKTTAVELNDFIPVTGGSLTFLYTGDNLTTDINIQDVIVHPAVYTKVGTIGQLNDALYIGELESEPDLNDMQPYASMIKMEWNSELLDAVNPPDEHINGTKKGMMHQEVYALYVRYRKVRGGTTKWFTIPGNTPLTADIANSTESPAGGGSTVPKFKVEDTIPYYNPATFSGGTGVWKNDTELYPDTIDFDSSALGGTNLRNQPVLHHRMPSIKWCKDNLYSTETRYGKTHLDILGLSALNVRIPAKYIGIIDGYEIGYAKRTIGNMTIYGQSVLMHGANADTPTPIYTTGGNFEATTRRKRAHTVVELNMKKDTFRFHGFDVLFNKPSIEPTFISAQLRMRKNLTEAEYLEDGGWHEARDMPIVHLIDYTEGENTQPILPGKQLRKIDKSFYLTVDVNANDFVNIHHENTFAGKLLGTAWDLNTGFSGWWTNEDYTNYEAALRFEETYLINLLTVKADLYSSVFSQSLVSAGTMKNLTDATPFFGGDVFIADYTFHTYGRHDKTDIDGDGIRGIKIIRRFICESISNINLRYVITGNDYSKWYPNNGVVADSPDETYISRFDRSKDPNQFGYSKDFNALNDLIESTIYSPFREEITVFPYRIHRGGKLSKQSRPRSWRTFLPLDYYEMQKNMGRIIHLEGMDDRLLIHMENALFLTQDKATLDSSQLSVTLGSGDIFQFEPQPAESSKLGVGGTQHDLACVNTPVGYVFPDAKQGELYIFKGKLTNLGMGINTFIREYLKIKDKNNYTGNGITIGWDQKYKRILLTVKNRSHSSLVPKIFADTTAFWSSLIVGDIINYNGRLIQYQGVNADPVYHCPADPVVDVIIWQKTNPSCQQVSGNNTGMRVWANRARLTNGTLDGYTEANSPSSGLGPYFPPVQDLTSCPLPTPVTTWQGSEASCAADVPSCIEGYTLSADHTLCTKNDTTPATVAQSSICVLASPLAGQYSGSGTKLYSAGYTSRLLGSYSLLTTGYWMEVPASVTGPMNRVAIWTDLNCDGTKDAPAAGTVLQFTKQITSVSGEIIYVGVGGDNTFRLDILNSDHPDGITIVDCDTVNTAGGGSSADNFNYWHLFPVVIPAGSTLLNFKAVGDGTTNDAFGAVIYRNTSSQLIAATTDADLTISFKTTDIVGTPIDIASCPAGWVLDTAGGSGAYICRRTLTSVPVVVNSGLVVYAKRCRYLNGIPDGYCEDNTSGANHVDPVVDHAQCPVPAGGLECGANVKESFTGTGLHSYDGQVIAITGKDVSINWDCGDRPNKFTVKKDGVEWITSGWKGFADYSGPWGTALAQTPESGSLTYTPEAGHAYSIIVQAGPANPDNTITDSYDYTITCT